MGIDEKNSVTGQSMFSNFNPDAMKAGRIEINLEAMPILSVWMVTMQLLDVCANWHRYDNCMRYVTLSNDEFVELGKSIEELAWIGFENRESMIMAAAPLEIPSELKFEDKKLADWAFHGLALSPNSKTSHSQIYGYLGLLLIDQAITTAGKSGISASFVDDLATVSFYLAEARAAEYLQDDFKLFMREIDLDRESEYKRRESQLASLRASIRHEPHRAAREFVKEEWGKHQTAYEYNKSAFARDYVRIVANKFSRPGGEPVTITEKQMRDVWLADSPPARKQVG